MLQIVLLLALIAVLGYAGLVLLRSRSAASGKTEALLRASAPRGGGLLLCDRCGAENTHSGPCVGCGARV